MQAGKVNNGYFHTSPERTEKNLQKFVINRAIFRDQNSPLDSMPGVFPILASQRTQTHQLLTLSRSPSLFLLSECLGKKKITTAAGIYCTCQFHKTKMRVIYGVRRILFFFSPLHSPFFCLNTLYSVFSLSVYPQSPCPLSLRQVYQNQNWRVPNQHL